MTTQPLPRTLLLIDTERFSDRDDVQQAYLRRMLFGIVDRVLLAAGIDQTLRLRADRGDAVMELIDPAVPLTTLLRALLIDVPAELRSVNRMAASSAQIRLRAVLATGYVAVDEYDGWVGTDLNQACRLLDAEALRAALRERGNDYALCVSESVHSGIVRHQHTGIPAEEFNRITVLSKNGPLTAWLHGPLPATDDPAPDTAPHGTLAAPQAPRPVSSGGIDFRGTNHGAVANQITGDITFGGPGGRK
ncbi:hypothetical protein OG264_23120 [Streptomyces xanthophaeus]|uniref:hypothetical protein n=1 Tax=Streptomyces xanthophaeus TaxID=67385 RepID=UPI003867AC4D|nr:hypothetical protein OG264_23120 [Streptomyces xanthophaeus]WST60896.1 hypothetical protein OG605_15325 [Streptomyces xanthophaeus]